MNTFKDIPGYENLYQINKEGIVKGIPKTVDNKKQTRVRPSSICKPVSTANGRSRILLCKNGFCTRYSVHQLVAMTFLKHNLANGYIIEHINKIKSDNRLDNLRVVKSKFNKTKVKTNKDMRIKEFTTSVRYIKRAPELPIIERILGWIRSYGTNSILPITKEDVIIGANVTSEELESNWNSIELYFNGANTFIKKAKNQVDVRSNLRDIDEDDRNDVVHGIIEEWLTAQIGVRKTRINDKIASKETGLSRPTIAIYIPQYRDRMDAFNKSIGATAMRKSTD